MIYQRQQTLLGIIIMTISSIKCSGIATVALVGDINFSGITYNNVKNGHCTYNESFEKIKKEFTGVDHIIANFESPVGDLKAVPKPLIKDKLVHLLADLDCVQALNYLNVSAVSLANNHFMDFNDTMNQTIKAIDKAKIQYSGVTKTNSRAAHQKPVILYANNISIGLLSYCANEKGCYNIRNKSDIGVAVLNYSSAAKEAIELKKRVDAVIAFLHWDNEYTILPNKFLLLNATKYLIPHFDVIVGMHQHVPSGHFYYQGTLIVLGLGNFLFPMHLTPAYKYNIGKTPQKNTEKSWYKMTKKYKNPSSVGKILKLKFNKKGLIKDDSWYENIQIDVNKKKCLYNKRKPDSSWQVICNKNDEDCMGTSNCNPAKCTRKKKKLQTDGV